MNEKTTIPFAPKQKTNMKKPDERLTKKREKRTSESARLRYWVQWVVFTVTIGIGIQFFIYVHQAFLDGPIRVMRPPAVEGFLPIGALMGWKLFLLTGIWDAVHPAAMVILGYAGFASLMLRKSFCGWFCPVGTVSERLWKLGRRFLGDNFIVPFWLDIPLRSLKYLLLGFFAWVILKMPTEAIHAFLQSPYYRISDVKMLFFFTRMSMTTAVVLTILVLLSLPIRNFWCRYLCPYGALMGLLALVGPTRIVRNSQICIDCERCAKACPYHLPVDKKECVLSPECNGCMDCTLACPVNKTLEMKTKGMGKRVWSLAKLGTLLVIVFVGLVYTARITGHWKSSVTDQEFRMRLKEVDSPHYVHPGIKRK
ncbi:MAG: 4Fe-4S binding protein [Desulfobacterales bacterium]|nr:4Fe-4S binding protein [Desulfobacterales bacterium]